MEVAFECLIERTVLSAELRKQSHRGVKFQVIGVAENFGNRALMHLQHQLRTGSQPRAEQVVGQIGLCFLGRLNGEASGHLAASQTGELREHKPHPVAAFAALVEFALDPFEHRVLGLDETLQVERVVLISASHDEALASGQRLRPSPAAACVVAP